MIIRGVRNKKIIESCVLVFAIIASAIVIVLPMKAPEAGAVVHLMSTIEEDNNPMYDLDPTPMVVLWNVSEDHVLNLPYDVVENTILIIPAMQYSGGPADFKVSLGAGVAIVVQNNASLLTNSDGNPLTTKTAFLASGLGNWDGIYFQPGSSGNISDCLFDRSLNGVQFGPGSTLLSPGIQNSTFINYATNGIRIEGAGGATNLNTVQIDNLNNHMGTGLYVADGSLNITSSSFFDHGDGESCVQVRNATVNVVQSQFSDVNRPGNCIWVEDNPAPNSTKIRDCDFQSGTPLNWYIRADGAEVQVINSTFQQPNGLTAIANDNTTGNAGHVYVINPNPGSLFNNISLNATGGSGVSLMWYLHVYVEDPDGNAISNVPVWVVDVNGAPAVPATKQTNATGWASWFMVRELVQYAATRVHFNPFNVSAENNSVLGYATPEPLISTTQNVNVVVPFSIIPNTLPTVIFISTPTGIQSGAITIDYILSDPDIGDDGNLSIEVYYKFGALGWLPASIDPSSPPTTGLNNNTLYSLVWDSSTKDMQDMYDTQVFLMIVPKDKSGIPGNNGTTFNFTVDNKIPVLMGGPTATPSDTSCVIEWTMNEPTYATVNYGLNYTGSPGDITDSTSDPTLSTSQSVTLTGLAPGREYIFIIKSTDEAGNTYTSSSLFTFETEIHIQMYTGWNLISLPPLMTANDIPTVFASIAGLYDCIQFYTPYDLYGDPWKQYIPGKPFGNDLFVIYPYMGVFVRMVTDAVFVHTTHSVPKAPTANPTEDIPLDKGWNLVGYPSVTNRPVDTALSGVTYDLIQTYNATSGQWESYDGVSGDLTMVEMGRGYWIHVPPSVPGMQFWSVTYHD